MNSGDPATGPQPGGLPSAAHPRGAADLAGDGLLAALHAGRVAAFTWEAGRDTMSWSGFCALFGTDRAHRAPDLLGLLQLVHADDRSLLHARLRHCLAVPDQRFDVQFRARQLDGVEFWVHGSGTVFRDLDGVPAGITGTLADISVVRELEAQQLQAQKLESIGNLAGGIAHDLSNLLTVILGEVQSVQQQVPHDAQVQNGLGGVQTAAQRAQQMIRRLQEFARRQELQLESCAADALLLAAEARLRQLLGSGISLRLQLSPRIGSVRADRLLLEQVLTQLCSNARDAMPNGGQLCILLDPLAVLPGQKPPHAGVPAGRYVRLRFVDNGPGMDAATRARVFEPFFSTREGTRGFGLSTCHGIVRQLGGHIWVDSAPGQGTTVTVLLPAGELLIERPPAPIEAPDAASARVLLVDDDDTLRAVAAGVLRSAGYLVLAASTAREALELAERMPDPIGMLITDLVMPGLGGVGLAERLQRRRPGIRILYITGYREQLIELLDQHETAAVLSKPFTAAELLGRVRELLDDGSRRLHSPV